MRAVAVSAPRWCSPSLPWVLPAHHSSRPTFAPPFASAPMPRALQGGFLSPHQQARRMGFRMHFFPQERSTETSYSSVPELSPVSCPKTPMTCQENPLAPRRCPAPTRLWALQAMYNPSSVSAGDCPFLSHASFCPAGSIPAESGTPYGKQYICGWRGYTWDLSELESRLWLASE